MQWRQSEQIPIPVQCAFHTIGVDIKNGCGQQTCYGTLQSTHWCVGFLFL